MVYIIQIFQKTTDKERFRFENNNNELILYSFAAFKDLVISTSVLTKSNIRTYILRWKN